jgi:hypothetical protein
MAIINISCAQQFIIASRNPFFGCNWKYAATPLYVLVFKIAAAAMRFAAGK